MKTETRSYILKEYGSWSVLTVAYLTGLLVSRGFTWKAIPLYISLALLINAKQAFMKFIRTPAGTPFIIFLSQIILAAGIFFALFQSEITRLLPLLIFPALYFLVNRLKGEHFVLTEVLGFILISLAAVLAKFLVTNGLDVRLFVAVAVYFSSGVFKVKTLLLRRSQERVMMAMYVLFSILMYRAFHIPVIILLPLIDNLIVAARPYKVKLQTTGWIEVGKSLLFLYLMALYF